MIRLAIVGYGNLGRGVEAAVRQNQDISLCAVFTRRDPATVTLQTPNVPVLTMEEMKNWEDKLDVLILCGGSATDLPVMTPMLAKKFNVVDSFDNHSKIPEQFAAVDAAASGAGKVAVISTRFSPARRRFFRSKRKGLQSLRPT